MLVALFVDNAREELEERRVLSDYLGDVAAEIQSNSLTIDIMEQRLLPQKAESLERVVAFLRDPDGAPVDTTALLADLVLSAGPIRPWT